MNLTLVVRYFDFYLPVRCSETLSLTWVSHKS